MSLRVDHGKRREPARWGAFLLASALFLTLCSCVDDTEPCTDVGVFGIVIHVVDAQGAPLATDDVVATATDENVPAYVETLESYGANMLHGAGERPGVYALVLEKPGFAPWTRSGIGVKQGRCHVEPVQIDAGLVAETVKTDAGPDAR